MVKELLCNKYLQAISELEASGRFDNIPGLVAKIRAQQNEEAGIALIFLTLEGKYIEQDIAPTRTKLIQLAKTSANGAFALGVLLSCDDSPIGVDRVQSESSLRRVTVGSLAKKLPNDKLAVAAKIIGDYYSDGIHFKKDLYEAYRFHELAAKNGCIDSLCSIGALLLNGGLGAFGDVLKIDEARGAKYLAAAHSKGSEVASGILAKYHTKKALGILRQVKSLDSDGENLLNAMAKIEWLLD